jgi:hypothetical protein
MHDVTARAVCRCGHTINHQLVSVKTKYSAWGLFWLSLAFSVKPIEVVYQCQTCGDIIYRSKDPELLERYKYNSDILRES